MGIMSAKVWAKGANPTCLETLDGADGAGLCARAAVQAVLGFNAVDVAFDDAFLRAMRQACPAPDADFRVDAIAFCARKFRVAAE